MWQNLTIPDSLQHKLDLFKGQGQLHHNQDDLFSSDSWYAVLNGMGVKPQTYDPIIDTSKYEIIEQAMKRSAQALMQSAAQTLDHQDYIQKMKK
nr:tryptophan 7-halogenase [Algibacillus agarilyticus]